MMDQDHEGVSAELRALTRDARRLLRDGGSRTEFAMLAGRITALSTHVAGPAPTPLTRWLESLRRRLGPKLVQGRGGAAPAAQAQGERGATHGRSGHFRRAYNA